MQTATLANGCFWCTEAIFKRLKGVTSVLPGYSGGNRENPTYEQVSSGTTGHAEAIQIEFDPTAISFEILLRVFFGTHDPTTLNRQGNDIGTQYRSAIFYHDGKQKEVAEKVKNEIDNSDTYKDPIVTQIVPYKTFYPAENYHKNFYENNRFSPYCMIVINPKVRKFIKEFSQQIKEEYKN